MSKGLPSLEEYSARIKDVYIELKEYEYYHSPVSKDAEYDNFIGRDALVARITKILENSSTKSGAYLVTGFRGMGKTSVVRKVIEGINEEPSSGKGKNPGINPKANYSGGTDHWLLLPLFTFFTVLFLALFFTPVPYFFFSWTSEWTIIHLYFPDFWIIFFEILIFYLLICIILFPFELARKFKLSKLRREKKLRNKGNKYKYFEINLSQGNVNEEEILKRITNNLIDYWKDDYLEFEYKLEDRKIYYPISLIQRIIQTNSQNLKVKRIVERLEVLNQRFSGKVTSDQEVALLPNLNVGQNLLGAARLNFPLGKSSRKNQVSYPIANPKEVEDELIRIFREISKLQDEFSETIPEFIFVIDELDKIFPNVSSNLTERESSDPDFDRDLGLSSTGGIRQRQEAIGQLMGNLKGFLNVIRAKFFFIGGRELYDASLADIADRDAFYSSIFNDILYVNSFFKDKTSERGGITQMAEAFLVKLILGKSGNKNLRIKDILSMEDTSLGKQLKIFIGTNQDEKTASEGKELNNFKDAPLEANDPAYFYEQARYKLAFLLQNYIIYLAYRCNGSPKKLITLIERIITPFEKVQDSMKGNSLILYQNNLDNSYFIGKKGVERTRQFLRFKFNDQYEIGLTSDIFRPYLITKSRQLKSIGDKLLFSSSFILDHILKFHPFGFSWRNLELIPEVILVNKEPNLRRFIEQLILFLSKTHIRPTVSGIFQYRFYNQVSRELMVLSKISDFGAAAFNFTLDESIQIKRHYKRKLSVLEQKYNRHRPINGDNEFIHAICFVQTILGDLHYYDKEYDDAIIYYSESIQSLRLPQSGGTDQLLTRHQFFLWLRNKLKLGLALEKIRAYNSAFSIYRTTCLDLPIYLNRVVDNGQDVIFDKNERTRPYRSLQMLTMPFIAWLSVIEKQRNDGITLANLNEKEKEVIELLGLKNKLNTCSNTDLFDGFRQHYLLADYYHNVGSLLFFKNHNFLPFKRKRKPNGLSLEWIKYQNLRKRRTGNNWSDCYPSISALEYFLKALNHLMLCFEGKVQMLKGLSNEFSSSDFKFLNLLPALLLKENLGLYNANRALTFGMVLSKVGDAILGCIEQKPFMFRPKDAPEFQFSLVREFESEEGALLDNRVKEFWKGFNHLLKTFPFSIPTVLQVYRLAASFYLRGGRTFEASLQYKKILYTLKDAISVEFSSFRPVQSGGPYYKERKNTICRFLGISPNASRKNSRSLRKKNREKIEKTFSEYASIIFRFDAWNYEIANRPQITKYRDTLNVPFVKGGKDPSIRSMIYTNINQSQGLKEGILVIEEIKLKLAHHLLIDYSENIKLDNSWISPYQTISSKFLRILELRGRCENYYFLIKKKLNSGWLFEKDENIPERWKEGLSENLGTLFTNEELGGNYNEIEVLIFLIKESIFCLQEAIRSVHLFDPGYIIVYSYLAELHRKLGRWCQAYENFKFKVLADFPNKEADKYLKILQESLEKVIGKHGLLFLEPHYHYENAIQNYYRSLQMHSEGRMHRSLMMNLYASEDDFSDDLLHFTLAIERLKVNTGNVREKINELKKIIKKDSSVYNYSSYFPQKPKYD